MIDLEHLEKFVVVPVGKYPINTVGDLRQLEADFGDGVYLLWSDARLSVIAFAFEPALFKEDEAREWVRKAMEKPAGASGEDGIPNWKIKAFAASLHPRVGGGGAVVT